MRRVLIIVGGLAFLVAVIWSLHYQRERDIEVYCGDNVCVREVPNPTIKSEKVVIDEVRTPIKETRDRVSCQHYDWCYTYGYHWGKYQYAYQWSYRCPGHRWETYEVTPYTYHIRYELRDGTFIDSVKYIATEKKLLEHGSCN